MAVDALTAVASREAALRADFLCRWKDYSTARAKIATATAKYPTERRISDTLLTSAERGQV
jgi:hypothetical protein